MVYYLLAMSRCKSVIPSSVVTVDRDDAVRVSDKKSRVTNYCKL